MDLLLEKCIEEKQPFKIFFSKYFTLGSDNVDYFKNFSRVSKSHATLAYHDQSWYIKDVSCKTGVYVNLARIGSDPVKLSYWDVIGLGGPIMADGVFFCVLCPKEVAALVTTIAEKGSVSALIHTQEDNDPDKDDKGMKTRVVDLEDDLPVFSYVSDFLQVEEVSYRSLENDSTCTQEENDSGIRLKDEKGMGKHSMELESQPCGSNGVDFFTLKKNSFSASENDSDGSTVAYLYSSESGSQRGTLDDGDDCGLRRTSSVESLDIVMYPSPDILAKIDAEKKSKRSRTSKKRPPKTKKYKMKSKTQPDSELKERRFSKKSVAVKRGRKKTNLNKRNKDSQKMCNLARHIFIAKLRLREEKTTTKKKH